MSRSLCSCILCLVVCSARVLNGAVPLARSRDAPLSCDLSVLRHVRYLVRQVQAIHIGGEYATAVFQLRVAVVGYVYDVFKTQSQLEAFGAKLAKHYSDPRTGQPLMVVDDATGAMKPLVALMPSRPEKGDWWDVTAKASVKMARFAEELTTWLLDVLKSGVGQVAELLETNCREHHAHVCHPEQQAADSLVQLFPVHATCLNQMEIFHVSRGHLVRLHRDMEERAGAGLPPLPRRQLGGTPEQQAEEVAQWQKIVAFICGSPRLVRTETARSTLGFAKIEASVKALQTGGK